MRSRETEVPPATPVIIVWAGWGGKGLNIQAYVLKMTRGLQPSHFHLLFSIYANNRLSLFLFQNINQIQA